MLNNPRKLLLAVGAALIIIGGFMTWRALHPPLTDQQQIAAEIEETRNAIESRNTGGAMKYLAKEFTWQGTTRKDIKQYIGPSFFNMRDVQLSVSGVNIQVQGQVATSTGHFHLTYRPSPNATPETQDGNFTLYWEKRQGNWEITRADGGPDALKDSNPLQ